MNFIRVPCRILKIAIEMHKVFFTRSFSCANQRPMRFVQYQENGGDGRGLGVHLQDGGIVVSLTAVDHTIPNDMVSFLSSKYCIENINKIVKQKEVVVPMNRFHLLPCITKPDKIICVGLNYKGHCDEQNKPYPKEPFFFSKFPSTIIGPNEPIRHPSQSNELDWEVEMAVVIGKKCKNVSCNDAYDYVFGYTVAQDISARDWQETRNNGQWLIAKSMDTFCPLGSVLVHKSEIHDPHCLQITCSINGYIKQCGSTSELIHRVDKLISYLSCLMTLLPGDIILTGTPSGVGVHRVPKEFLNVGDTIESEITCIGKMTNEVVADV